MLADSTQNASSSNSFSSSRKRPWLLIGATLLLAALFLAPILRSPLLGDDAFNSYIPGYMSYHGESWWQFWYEYDRRLVSLVGRWIPVTTLLFIGMWSTVHNAFEIKIVQITAILLDLLAFYGLVRRVSNSWRFALMATLLTIPTLQIRLFYDPVAGIMLSMQIVAGLSFWAASLFWDDLRAKSPLFWRTCLAVVLFTIAALSYEITYLYIFVFILIAYDIRRNIIDAAKAALPFIVTLGAIVAKDLATRQLSHLENPAYWQQHSEYTFSLSLLPIIRTWWLQTIGAIPLVYQIADPRHYFPAITTLLVRTSAIAPVIAALAAVIMFVVLRLPKDAKRESDDIAPARLRPTLALGILLTLSPGFLIALSPRWQGEITLGLAYLPVFCAGFGVALLIALVLNRALQRFDYATPLLSVLAIGFSLVTCIVYQANAITLSYYDPVWNWARHNFDESLRLGILRGVPSGATVFLDKSYPFGFESGYIWDTRYLIFMDSGRRVVARSPESEFSATDLCVHQTATPCELKSPSFEFHNYPRSYDEGDSVLVKVAQIRKSGDGSPVALADEAWLLERGASLDDVPKFAALGVRQREAHLVESGVNYRLFHLATSCPLVRSSVFVAQTREPSLQFVSGFYDAENDARNSWRWMRSSGSFAVENPSAKATTATVTFAVQTISGTPATAVIATPAAKVKISVSEKASAVKLQLPLGPLQAKTIRLETDAEKPQGLADLRDIHLGVFNPHVSFEPGC